MRCTSTISVVSQCKLVSGSGLRKWRSAFSRRQLSYSSRKTLPFSIKVSQVIHTFSTIIMKNNNVSRLKIYQIYFWPKFHPGPHWVILQVISQTLSQLCQGTLSTPFTPHSMPAASRFNCLDLRALNTHEGSTPLLR